MSALRPSRPIFTGAALSLSLVLAAAVLAAPSPVRAAEDEAPLDSRILRGLLESIGLQKEEKIINYQERAPLVIPPSKALPMPERGDAVANNPAWPKDPDVLRAKEEAARERTSNLRTTDEQLKIDARPLRPDELTPGPKPRAKVARTTQRAGSSSEYSDTGQKLTPSQLGYTGGLFGTMFGGRSDETAKFTGEPPRTSLTEPPPGYQTPSPDQPYGMSERSKAPKATNYMLERGADLPK